VKYVKICNAIPVWLKVYNMYNVPAWCLACKLEYHNVVVQQLEVDKVDKVMYMYSTWDGNTKIVT
jgi:hypothetical protein